MKHKIREIRGMDVYGAVHSSFPKFVFGKSKTKKELRRARKKLAHVATWDLSQIQQESFL